MSVRPMLEMVKANHFDVALDAARDYRLLLWLRAGREEPACCRPDGDRCVRDDTCDDVAGRIDGIAVGRANIKMNARSSSQ